jgi:hypothetical protein
MACKSLTLHLAMYIATEILSSPASSENTGKKLNRHSKRLAITPYNKLLSVFILKMRAGKSLSTTSKIIDKQ